MTKPFSASQLPTAVKCCSKLACHSCLTFYLCICQPLEIDEFVAELKNAGIKIASKYVIDFLDEQVKKLSYYNC